MPWFVWFSFFTAPVLVGVAFTLTSSANDPGNLGTVLLAGGLWALLAYQLKRFLKNARPQTWARRWVVLAVVCPLLTLFTLSLGKDAEIRQVFKRRAEASQQPEPDGLAPSAPSRRMLTWHETRVLAALVQPHAVRFSVQLLTSLPPAWWVIAFGIAIWKGRKA